MCISLYIRKPAPIHSFKVNNETIKTSNSAKYLRVVIDEQLSFTPHILQLDKKIARFVGIIAKLHYYLPKKTLITSYYSLVIVHPHLLYALAVWASTY